MIKIEQDLHSVRQNLGSCDTCTW